MGNKFYSIVCHFPFHHILQKNMNFSMTHLAYTSSFYLGTMWFQILITLCEKNNLYYYLKVLKNGLYLETSNIFQTLYHF